MLFLTTNRVKNVDVPYAFSHTGSHRPTCMLQPMLSRTHKSLEAALFGQWDLKSSGVLMEVKCAMSGSLNSQVMTFAGSWRPWTVPQQLRQTHTALGGQGSCSTSAACWLCKHRWSQPSWARYPPCLSHRIRMKYRSICCGNWLLHHVLLLLLFGAHLSRKVRRWISLCDNFQSL